MRPCLAGALVFGLAGALPAQVSPEYSRAFDAVDRQARQVTRHLKCVVDLADFARNGMATAADTSKAYRTCVLLGGRMVGTFTVVDSSWTRFRRLAAFDPARGERITGPLDTAEVLTLVMAQARAVWKLPDDSVQYLPPVALRSDSVIDVWLVPGWIVPLPAPANPVIGGERHFVMTPDGRRILRADSASRQRVVPRPPGSSYAWTVETASDSVPTFSEMLFASLLSQGGQAITFVMPTRIARLMGDFVVGVWVFQPKKP